MYKFKCYYWIDGEPYHVLLDLFEKDISKAKKAVYLNVAEHLFYVVVMWTR